MRLRWVGEEELADAVHHVVCGPSHDGPSRMCVDDAREMIARIAARRAAEPEPACACPVCSPACALPAGQRTALCRRCRRALHRVGGAPKEPPGRARRRAERDARFGGGA